MHWGNPEILWLLLLIPALGWLALRTLAWRSRTAQSIGEPAVLARLYPSSAARWRRRRLLLTLLGATLLIVAAARPQYGKVEQTFKTYGTSALIALDCSPSMNAHDVMPSRLGAAKDCLKIFLRKMQGNQVGIVAFAGTAFLQCPMTVDTGMAATILDSIDTDSVGLAGTDIGKAIEVSLTAFENAGDNVAARTLVLITDGEDNEGRGLKMAKKAAEMDVRIYAVGIGTKRGAPLEKKGGGFLENTRGLKVNSRMQMGTLAEIAKTTGGEAYEAGSRPALAVQSIVEAIYRQQKIELEDRKQIIYQDRFQWFLYPALLALIFSAALMPERSRIAPAPAARAERTPS